ncbi:MAG: hypothetical protein H7287_13160 [Thermoleophilia bacterium]|nr:hypothetical protein [Thermoleophilia bacterium]
MTDTQRNFLILGALAVIGVLFSGAFNLGTGAANVFLNIAFTVVLIWALINLYVRKSGTIAQIATVPRVVLQASCLALLLLLVTGFLSVPFLPRPFGWSRDYGLLFWGAMFVSGFGIWWGWQQRTSRW